MSEMSEDFRTPPPGRRLRRPEDFGLTDEQRRLAERDRLVGQKDYEPPPSLWAPAAPSHPSVRRLLERPHSPVGMPLPPAKPLLPQLGPRPTDGELAAHSGRCFRMMAEYQAADDEFYLAYLFWVDLDVAAKTQLASEAMYDNPAEPQWVVQVLPDPSVPPVVVRAPDAVVARERGRQLLLGKDPRGAYVDQPHSGYEPWSVTLYQPPEAANGAQGDR
jgi:hypothetical protein